MKIALLREEREQRFPHYDQLAGEHTLRSFSSAADFALSGEEFDLILVGYGRGEEISLVRESHPKRGTLLFLEEGELPPPSSGGSYIRGACSWEELSAALLLLQRGGSYRDADDTVQAAASGEDIRLTDREQEVLNRLSEGWTNRGIAGTLGISENTVKFHLNAVFRKLGAESRTEAVIIAAREGLLSL